MAESRLAESLKCINYPEGLSYSSDGDHLPIEFYMDVFPVSHLVYFKLGYFSSKAIQVLASSFAQFIYNGGSIKIITNHYLYNDDKKLLNEEEWENFNYSSDFNLSDINWLHESLSSSSKHFVNCLKYLVRNKRLELIPIILKPGSLVHYKEGFFKDKLGNVVSINGSCNFTSKGLLENGESLDIKRSWGSTAEIIRTKELVENIQGISEKIDSRYRYLSASEIEDAIEIQGEDKNLKELLEEELDLIAKMRQVSLKDKLKSYDDRLNLLIKIIKDTPSFPEGMSPRPYQIEAYSNWLANDKKGIFAMATGTGKTKTALNCLIEEYKTESCYQAIILVPSEALLDQWKKELKDFNFNKIYSVSSKNKKWTSELRSLNASLSYDSSNSFIIVALYQTFSKDKIHEIFHNYPARTVLIADEAHNIGSKAMKRLMPSLKFEKRIALSATPQRRFDENGNNLIEKTFNSTEPYTYNFSMSRAIDENILCQYEYYPVKAYLDDDEMDNYVVISKKLMKLFDQRSNSFTNQSYAEKLLLDRSRIIHKARNKLTCFKSIVENLKELRGSIKHTFVYTPEGEAEEGGSILNSYISAVESKYPNVNVHHYTYQSENRHEVMKNFELGLIDMLFSMKCLDEGVDIPRAENAIFCSSTGNPRQFIQRRGRVLRKHPDKDIARIFDIVVLPLPSSALENSKSERKIVRDELIRLIYFARLSLNYYESMNLFSDIAKRYNLNIYELEESLERA